MGGNQAAGNHQAPGGGIDESEGLWPRWARQSPADLVADQAVPVAASGMRRSASARHEGDAFLAGKENSCIRLSTRSPPWRWAPGDDQVAGAGGDGGGIRPLDFHFADQGGDGGGLVARQAAAMAEQPGRRVQGRTLRTSELGFPGGEAPRSGPPWRDGLAGFKGAQAQQGYSCQTGFRPGPPPVRRSCCAVVEGGVEFSDVEGSEAGVGHHLHATDASPVGRAARIPWYRRRGRFPGRGNRRRGWRAGGCRRQVRRGQFEDGSCQSRRCSACRRP